MNLPDAEHLAAELERLQFARFGIAEAWEVATAFQQRVRADRLPVSLRIVLGEQIVVHLAAPGTSADTDSWLHRKVNTVRRFGTSTLAVLLTFEQRGPEFAARAGLDPAQYALGGGGYPIYAAGSLVGAAAVSGLPHLDDHALVADLLRGVLDQAR